MLFKCIQDPMQSQRSPRNLSHGGSANGQTPKFEARKTFHVASVGSTTDLILLSPTIDKRTGLRLLPALQSWQATISIFTLPRLQSEVLHEGFFAIPTPSCYLPSTLIAVSEIPSGTASVASLAMSAVTLPTAIVSQSEASRSSNSRSRHTSSRSSAQSVSGESGRSRPLLKAQVPLLVRAQQGLVKPLGDVLFEINRNRQPSDKQSTGPFLLLDRPKQTTSCTLPSFLHG
jgi:hypothetical protein